MASIPEWVREAGKFSDFAIVCKDTEIRAHRVVLYGQSGYFKALLDSDMKEAREGIVTFDDVDPDVMRHLVGFFYTGDRGFGLGPSDLEARVSVWILADRLKAGQARLKLENGLMNYLEDCEHKNSAVREGLVDMVFSHPACAESAVGYIIAEAVWVAFARSRFSDADLALLTRHAGLMEKLLFWSHRYTQGAFVFSPPEYETSGLVRSFENEGKQVRRSIIEEHLYDQSCPSERSTKPTTSVYGPIPLGRGSGFDIFG